MGVDPYDPLSGERYEREKQRIEDVFAARRAMEKEANQPGGTVPPTVPTASSAPALPSAAAPALQRYSQERRDLQAKINQGVRDRYKIRLANSVDGATGAGIGYGARKAANEQGRTPFTDAMAQRMIMQQLSGF